MDYYGEEETAERMEQVAPDEGPFSWKDTLHKTTGCKCTVEH